MHSRKKKFTFKEPAPITIDPELSIIIPFRNRQHELSRLLNSIAEQGCQNHEVIIINDKSEEATDHFKSKADIWIENDINLGPSYSRNRGVLRSRGKTLLFLDSDVELRPDCLGTLIDIFSERADVHAIGGSGPPTTGGDDVRHILAKFYSPDGVNTKIRVTAETAGADGLVPCDHLESAFLAIRREAFFQTGGFDPYWFYMGEDRDLCLRLKELGYTLYASWPTRALHFEAGATNRDEEAFTHFLHARYLEVAVKRHGVEGGKRWLESNNQNLILTASTVGRIMEDASFLDQRKHTDFLEQKALDEYVITMCKKAGRQPTSMSPVESINPTSLVLFVTSRCNARCSHCFIDHDSVTDHDDFDLSSLRLLLHGIASPLSLILTGGEPTLRSDLLDMCAAALASPSVSTLAIMTNGSRPGKIAEICSNLLKQFSKPLRIQVSIDGPGPVHDARRNVAGLYNKAMATAQVCHTLKEQFPHFSYVVSITVGKDTRGRILDLIGELSRQGIESKVTLARDSRCGTFSIPSHLIAPYPISTSEQMLNVEEIDDLIAKIEINYPGYLSVLQSRKLDIMRNTLLKRQRQVPCLAGFQDAVIYENLDVSLCEHTIPFGNLAQWGMNLEHAWNSAEAWIHRAQLTTCACIHGCNISTSLNFQRR